MAGLAAGQGRLGCQCDQCWLARAAHTTRSRVATGPVLEAGVGDPRGSWLFFQLMRKGFLPLDYRLG